jgi:hypothetical protein
MPDTRKPWHKDCPARRHERYPGWASPCACHGTGYVPMNTDEMLEALSALGSGFAVWQQGSWCVRVRGMYFGEMELIDALRAAMEVVMP